MSSSNKIIVNQPILCIPGVFANIKEDRIRRIFGDLNLGEVTRVDIVVPKKLAGADEKENKFNRVFIHIDWNESHQSIACRERLNQGKEIKIIYDEPWFWRVSAYRPPAPKPKFESQSKKPKGFQAKKATIQIDFEPEVKYSGVIAPGLTSVIAQGLTIQIPDKNISPAVYEPKSPITSPPAEKERIKQYQENFIKKEKSFNYGKLHPAPKKKKLVIIDSESK